MTFQKRPPRVQFHTHGKCRRRGLIPGCDRLESCVRTSVETKFRKPAPSPSPKPQAPSPCCVQDLNTILLSSSTRNFSGTAETGPLGTEEEACDRRPPPHSALSQETNGFRFQRRRGCFTFSSDLNGSFLHRT